MKSINWSYLRILKSNRSKTEMVKHIEYTRNVLTLLSNELLFQEFQSMKRDADLTKYSEK